MMERVGKTYTFKNGYSICKCSLYDGYNMQYFWKIFNKDGSFRLGVYSSYEEASAEARKLK